jgi:hypothetical protein
VLESSVTAIGLALLVTLTLLKISVYPQNWVLVIGIAIAVLGVRWPLVAYLLSVGALVYPIYTINLYLAVLFVAVGVLGYRIFVHYMGATLLVLATPFLAQYHLQWLVPILGGLWWGGIKGAWIGGLAAIWGKLLGGMAGLDTDWLVLAGQAPDMEALMLRFQEANSLETLLLIIEPFAAPANVILYNLLQIVSWAVAGGFVGALADRKWVKYRAPWSIMVVTAGGGLILLLTHLTLPYWLQDAITDETIEVLRDPAGSLFSLLIVIIVGTAVYTFRESLDLPVAPKRKAKRKKAKVAKSKARQPKLLQRAKSVRGKSRKNKNSRTEDAEIIDDLDRPRRPVRVPHQSELPEWEPPRDDSGLIMLEID